MEATCFPSGSEEVVDLRPYILHGEADCSAVVAVAEDTAQEALLDELRLQRGPPRMGEGDAGPRETANERFVRLGVGEAKRQ